MRPHTHRGLLASWNTCLEGHVGWEFSGVNGGRISSDNVGSIAKSGIYLKGNLFERNCPTGGGGAGVGWLFCSYCGEP